MKLKLVDMPEEVVEAMERRHQPSALERLAAELEMTPDEIREAAHAIGIEKMKERLMEKVRLIRERNTAILPTGEIVARGTPGAMDYESSENDEHVHHYRRERASITGLGLKSGGIIETERLVVVARCGLIDHLFLGGCSTHENREGNQSQH